MNKYQYTVKLEVEVEAFDESDAWDAIQESFGAGQTGAVLVTECQYKEKLARRK